MSELRFHIVHSGPDKWHARVVAGNGRTVWVTESYRRRREAVNAIDMLEWFDPQIIDVDERAE